MANLTETPTYDVGVYQIETTDPVLGGANGIANTQAKQLANRTSYLKVRADVVDAAKGNSASLAARLDGIDTKVAATSPDMMEAFYALIIEAMGKSGLALREIMKTLNQRFQTGQVTIRNAGVVSGCDVSAGGTGRMVNNTAGVAYLAGMLQSIPAVTGTASIAQNTGTSPGTVELYIDSTGDIKATALNEKTPAGNLLLYQVTVPAGNIVENLTGCTFTKVAASEPNFPMFLSDLPKASIVLPFNMDAATYRVDLEVVSQIGAAQQLGRLSVANKTTTGFDILLNGTADSVVVNWTARKLDL